MLACAGCGDLSTLKHPQKEMLIYCGITMIQPVREIAQNFEKQNKCIVKIIKGGSGDLLKAIERSQKGDLYLPGEASYMDACISDGVCRSSVCVGYNRSVMVVRKGNPLNIPSELKSMTNRSYRVVIGDPDTGSIGKEAKSVLEKADLFNEVIANNPVFTTDSKDISKAIQNGHADLGINWYATTQWPENAPHIDALPIPEHYAPKTPLLLGLLGCSGDLNLAKEFMKNAISPEGKEIFNKFGFEPSF
jgi:molybdate transport system substrate-binding protein